MSDMASQLGKQYRLRISVVIPTLNEEVNIAHALSSVVEFDEVVVVDSGSTDRTREVARDFSNVRVMRHDWPGYGAQKNWAAQQVQRGTDWLVFLDADERLEPGAAAEIYERASSAPSAVTAFSFRRDVIFLGGRLPGLGQSAGFTRAVRMGRGHFEDRLVNEHLITDGSTSRLRCRIIHDDRKPLIDWLHKQLDYSDMEARTAYRPAASAGRRSSLSLGARFRRRARQGIWTRLPARPVLAFVYFFVFNGLFRFGRPGYYYSVHKAVNAAHQEMLMYEWDRSGKP